MIYLYGWTVVGAMMYQYPTVIVNGRTGINLQDLRAVSYMLEFSPDLEMCKALQQFKV